MPRDMGEEPCIIFLFFCPYFMQTVTELDVQHQFNTCNSKIIIFRYFKTNLKRGTENMKKKNLFQDEI